MFDFVIIGDHKVLVNRRKGQKHLRLRVNSDGKVILSAPNRYPMFLLKEFLNNKKDWMKKHSFSQQTFIDGVVLFSGESIHIEQTSKRNKTEYRDNKILFYLSDDPTSDKAQKYIKKQIIKHYSDTLINILDERLEHFSKMTSYKHKSMRIGHFKSKWGSCDNKKNIKFSIYLISVDSYLRDYVVLHELVHTKYMNHSKDFWRAMELYMPDYKDRQKQLKNKKMTLLANAE